MGRRGHRSVAHTADVIVEAWGPDRAACLEEAVLGTVATFVGADRRDPSAWHDVAVTGADEDVLVDLLGEVIYLLDARDEVVVAVAVAEAGARLGTVPVGTVEVHGAIPKAVTYHRLRIGPDDAGTWRCAVTLDV